MFGNSEACVEKWERLPDELKQRARERVSKRAKPSLSRAPTADFDRVIPWGTGIVSSPLSIDLMKEHTRDVMKFKQRSELLAEPGLRNMATWSSEMMKEEHKQRAPNSLHHEQQPGHVTLNLKSCQRRRRQAQ